MTKCIRCTLIIAIIVLIVYNICVNGSNFFNITIGEIMTIAVAVYFAYYLAQMNTDARVRKGIYTKILQDLQNLAEDRDSYVIDVTSFDKKKLMMTKRKFNNCVTILKRYANAMNVKTLVDTIEKHVNEYAELLGNHIDDIEYLSKSENELRRPLDLIVTEVPEIMMKLYSYDSESEKNLV